MVQHHILVGTFDKPFVFTLAFDAAARSLEVVAKSKATGAHSWLSLSVCAASYLHLIKIPTTLPSG